MRRKTIPVPGIKDVDISAIMPIVRHRTFQLLRWKKQLGVNFFTFPDATHSRFLHSLAAFSLTQERAERWVQERSITEQEAWDVALFALLHDIGHGPYSHLTEDVCHHNHNVQGGILLEQLRRPIEKCGGDFENVCTLFKRANPLSQCVSHTPVGAEKIAYLKQDARHTTEAVSPTTDALLNHTHFVQGKLAIDKTITEEVVQLQNFYVYMYGRVYWRKKCLIAERFLQQMVLRLFGSGELSEEKLWGMIDSELDAAIVHSRDPIVVGNWQRLVEDRFPKVAIVICTAASAHSQSVEDKPIALFQIEAAQLQQLEQLRNPQVAERLEARVAAIAQIPPHAVVLTPLKPIDRFVLPDIPICENGKLIGRLKDERPQHYLALHEKAAAHAAAFVCVFEEYRERVSAPDVSRKIADYLLVATKNV